MSVEECQCREELARWMREHSLATGHGETMEDLLAELSWQVRDLQNLTNGLYKLGVGLKR